MNQITHDIISEIEVNDIFEVDDMNRHNITYYISDYELFNDYQKLTLSEQEEVVYDVRNYLYTVIDP
jgi:hypothetical protein